MPDTNIHHQLGGMSPINDFCARNSVGRSFVYQQIKIGKLTVIKAGKKTLVTFEEELRWRQSLAQTVQPVERLQKRRSNRPSAGEARSAVL